MAKNARNIVDPLGTSKLTIGSDEVGDYVLYPNGVKHYYLTSAITADVTETSAALGSKAETSNATGRSGMFYSDGDKWQLIVTDSGE